MELVDGKLIKCLVWRDSEDPSGKEAELAEASYQLIHRASQPGNLEVHFDYYVPAGLAGGNMVSIPLGGKKIIIVDPKYATQSIYSGGRAVNYINWLYECIQIFEQVEGPDTLIVPLIKDCGRIEVVEI